MSGRLIWHRITHWEYWPFWLIYYPMFPVWLYFSIKARSFFFFNAANPLMKNGGMAMESKNDIYGMIPKKNIPETVLVEKNTTIETVLESLRKHNIDFPCIAKPDIGMKAFGVDKIHNEFELQAYINRTPERFLVQELIPYQKEVGIFYVRFPGEEKGRITGIVSKEFLAVVGDGKKTVLQLIKANPRSHFQLKVLLEKFGDELSRVLESGEQFILVPYGSHTRGAKFIDVTDKLNDGLLEVIDSICRQMPEFYYGRLDVLYNTFEELSDGKNFRIIEVNGAGGEATHIYDPKHSLFFAWREITRHWGYMCKISILNHRKGHPYLSYRAGREMLKANSVLEQQLKLV